MSIERNQVAKNKAEIVIAMTDTGEILVKTTTGNHCTNLGMIEIAKVIIVNQMKGLNADEPSRIARI